MTLPGIHGGQFGTSNTQRNPIPERKQEGTRHRWSCAPAALIAAKPRIKAMIRDAVAAGLLLEQPLVTRLAAVYRY